MKKIFVPTGALLDKEMNKGGYMWKKAVEKWKSLDGKVQIIIAVVAVFFLLALFFGSPVPDVQR